jgi:hypothetical protein
VIHQSLLGFRRGRYLWWAASLSVAAALVYLTPTGMVPKSGGTWQGYLLGTVGAGLIVWLTLLGVRKRSYGSTLGTVQGWASAHVYLGLALIVVATLHCAFELGWNVHTLAYVLMCLVIGTGIVGVGLYLTLPELVRDNRAGGTRPELFGELYDLDVRARQLAAGCNPEAALAASSSIERTAIGGGLVAQLAGSDQSWMLLPGSGGQAAQLTANPDQQAAVDYVSSWLPRAQKRAEVMALQELVAVLCRRQMILRRIRRDVRLNGWLKVWLYLHVPLTLALIAALLVHIVLTLMYW